MTEIIRPGLPVREGACVKGPPLGPPISRCRARLVSAPLELLMMLPEIQPQGAPRTHAAAVPGLQRTP